VSDNTTRTNNELKSRISDLSSQLKHPQKIEEILIEACYGLMDVLDSLQDNQLSAHLEVQRIDQTIQHNINNLLKALSESTRYPQEKLFISPSRSHSEIELICRLHPDGSLHSANNAFLNYFSNEQKIQPGDNLINRLPPNEQSTIRKYISSLRPSDPVIRLDYSFTLPDQNVRWLQWTGLGSFNDEGKLLEIQVIGQDISERKLDEQTAQQHNRELSALHNATAALLTTLDPEALLSRILDAALSAVPAAKKGMIHLIAPDTGQLEMRASVGYTDPRIVRIRIPGAVGYVARAVKERNPLLIHNLHTDPVLATGPYNHVREVNSAIVAPLILKSQVLGALSLESTQTSAFNDSDLRLLVSFAATATAAIHNAHLHAEVQKLAITDSLTGLYNRRGFYELGQREVERSRRYKRPLVAIMLDIDHFKFINDFYGHAIGDYILQSIAKRCSDSLRRIDILGRLGGDEFTILLPETDMFTATGVAERVRNTISNQPVITDPSPVTVSVSLGVARATATTPDLDILISRADKALYTAKREGRNRVEYG
jgi:diguanylate cyclase (GGDEF)-like protein